MNTHGFVRDLELLVNIDSGSYNAVGVNKIADFCQSRLIRLGCSVERIPTDLGDVVIGRRKGNGGPKILLLGHMDTVFEDGTAAARPFRIEGATAYGPGVCDDKGGLLAGLYALESLIEQGREPYDELIFCCSPDEEIGGPGSRPIIEALAAEAAYALCLECARENGDLVKARKGAADLTVEIEGKAAHAGIEPERGANAALAAAHLTVALQSLNGLAPGVTVNVGVIRAGSRPNIVCPRASIELELRATALHDLNAVLHAVDLLVTDPGVPGTRATVRRGLVCPPMEADERLVATALAAARSLGMEVGAAVTGGVGDANLCVPTPTLDGLGPVGGGDHSDAEWLDLDSVGPRISLLVTLINSLQERS